MNATLKDCVALYTTIHQLQSKPLPFKVGFKLNKIAKALQDDYYTYMKALNDVITKYGERDEKGNLKQTKDGIGVLLQKDKAGLALEEMQEVDKTECEIPDIWFKPDELEELELSLQQIESLQIIIKEEESN